MRRLTTRRHDRRCTAASNAPRTEKEKRQALQDFLCGQDASTLADKLLEFADRDHDISRELQQWRKASEVGTEPADLKPALARYRRAVTERWRQAKDAVLARKAEHAAKVPGRKGRAPVYESTSERDMNLWTLEGMHLAQLESEGRVDEALAVLREDLSEAHAHSQIISYLEKHQRFRDALAQAEQGSVRYFQPGIHRGDAATRLGLLGRRRYRDEPIAPACFICSRSALRPALFVARQAFNASSRKSCSACVTKSSARVSSSHPEGLPWCCSICRANLSPIGRADLI